VALAVTTTETGLHLASERHARYGPDPEDVHVEIQDDPLTLSVVDAGGRTILRLGASDESNDAPARGQPTLAWTYVGAVGGLPPRALPRRSAAIALALEPDEHLFGLDARAGPRDRVGASYILDALADQAEGSSADHSPPARFVLSSRGYGLFVHSRARLTADLGEVSAAEYTLTVDEATLDLFLFPATWPRTALAAYASLTGRPPLPPASAFGVAITLGNTASDADLQATADHLRADATPGETPRRGSPGSMLPRSAAVLAGADGLRHSLQVALALGLAAPGRWPTADEPPSAGSAALYARWAQQQLLAPFAQIPTRTEAVPGGSDERAFSIVRAYAGLRYRLLPYLLHCARETAQQGLPMLRPLLLEFSWDAEATTIDDQYLLGRDLLVAPIFEDSAADATRRVYLPRYANWYDWWTGQFVEGGQWLDVTAPLEHIPLYARAGTAIPIGEARGVVGEDLVEVTRLLLFAPADGAIGASIELPDGELLGVEHERGADRARIFIEGLPPTIRALEIVGIPSSAEIVDAASPRIQIVPGDDSLPGLGGAWEGITVRLDARAYTTGLELRW